MMKKLLFSILLTVTVSLNLKANLFDLQMNFNVEDSSGLGGQAAVVFTGTEFWSAQWATNVISRFDATGSFIDTFTIAGLSGTRGMVLNGSNIYAVNNTDSVFVIDVATKTISSNIILPTQVRFITFDPSANGGSGGIWAGFWSTDFVLYDLNGNVLNTITSATHGFTTVYSFAFDDVTTGGPYLWVFHQGGSSSQAEIDRLEISTGNRANINFDVNADLGYTSSLAGGLFITDALVTGQWTLGGLLQTTPDNVFAYELNDLILPDYDVETSFAEINDGLTQYPLNHANANLTASTILKNNGGLDLDSVKVLLEIFDDSNNQVYADNQVFNNLVSGSITNVDFMGMNLPIGRYSATIVSEILGHTDLLPTDNNASFSFDITKDQMARIDGNINSGAYSINGDAWGNIVARYDLAITDSLGSINVNFQNAVFGDTTYGMIFSNVNGEPGALIARTPDYLIDNSDMNLWFNDTIELMPGSYFFGVYEATYTAINLAHSSNNYRPGVNFFRTAGGSWNASSIETARAINPKFNWDEVNCTGYSATLTKTSGIVYLGDLTTLTATPTDPNVASVEWKLGGVTIAGATGLTYDYTATTLGTKNFQVSLEATNGCTTTKFLSFTVLDTVTENPGVGIIEIEKNDFVSVFPNPVSEMLKIELNEHVEDYLEAIIIDINGRAVREFPLQRSGMTKVSVSSLTKGVYIVKLLSKENVVYKEIVVE